MKAAAGFHSFKIRCGIRLKEQHNTYLPIFKVTSAVDLTSKLDRSATTATERGAKYSSVLDKQ